MSWPLVAGVSPIFSWNLGGAIPAAAVEVGQHAAGAREQDVKAPRFPDAGRALDQHVLVTLEEVPSGEIEDLLADDPRVEAEVKRLEGPLGLAPAAAR